MKYLKFIYRLAKYWITSYKKIKSIVRQKIHQKHKSASFTYIYSIDLISSSLFEDKYKFLVAYDYEIGSTCRFSEIYDEEFEIDL